MAKTSEKKLAYMAEYQKSPEEVKKREARNKARYAAIRDGKVKKGDKTKQVDHVTPLGAGGSADVNNTRVISTKKNEGWRHGESSYKSKKA